MSVNKQAVAWVFAIALLATLTGCGSSSDSASGNGSGSSMDEMAAQLEVQETARQQEQARQVAAKKAEEAAAAAAQAAPEPEVVTAHSPQKGRSLEGGGYLSIVTGTRFWAEHQMILNNVTHATRLYEAEKGHYPRTQEEFMREVIEPNKPTTTLPQLPDGYEYFYDPKEPLVLKMINTGAGQPGAVD